MGELLCYSINTFWHKIKSFIQLVRFGHAVIFVAGFIIGAYLLNINNFSIYQLIVGAITILFSEIGAFAINDSLDAEADKINKRRDRPIVRGEIGKEVAMKIGILLTISSIITAAFLNYTSFLFVLLINIGNVLYNYYLKNISIIGNAYVAFTMAAPFIFAYTVLNNGIGYDNRITFISITAFLFGIGREIAKDVMDMKGDMQARNAKSLPSIIGDRNTILIVGIIFIISAIYIYTYKAMLGCTYNSASIRQTVCDYLITGFSGATGILGLIAINDIGSNNLKKTSIKIRKYSMWVLVFGIISLIVCMLNQGGCI